MDPNRRMGLAFEATLLGSNGSNRKTMFEVPLLEVPTQIRRPNAPLKTQPLMRATRTIERHRRPMKGTTPTGQMR